MGEKLSAIGTAAYRIVILAVVTQMADFNYEWHYTVVYLIGLVAIIVTAVSEDV